MVETNLAHSMWLGQEEWNSVPGLTDSHQWNSCSILTGINLNFHFCDDSDDLVRNTAETALTQREYFDTRVRNRLESQ